MNEKTTKKDKKDRKSPRKAPEGAIALPIPEEEQKKILEAHLKDRFVNPLVHWTNKPDLIVYVTPQVKA